MASSFNAQNFGIRWFFALILVFSSYNPHGYSYYDWTIIQLPEFSVIKIFLGIVLVIGWTIFLRATLRSLGVIGLSLALAFFGTLIWLIVDWGLVPADSVKAVTDLVLVMLSAILATGMSWSHIRRRMSGQTDMDDVDEE